MSLAECIIKSNHFVFLFSPEKTFLISMKFFLNLIYLLKKPGKILNFPKFVYIVHVVVHSTADMKNIDLHRSVHSIHQFVDYVVTPFDHNRISSVVLDYILLMLLRYLLTIHGIISVFEHQVTCNRNNYNHWMVHTYHYNMNNVDHLVSHHNKICHYCLNVRIDRIYCVFFPIDRRK